MKAEVKKVSVNQGVKQVTNEVKKVSVYKEVVLNSNKLLKQELSSIGACRAILIENSEAIKLDAKFKNLLIESKKNQDTYEQIKQVVKPSKSGKFSPFGVLQGLYRIVYKDVKKVSVKSEK